MVSGCVGVMFESESVEPALDILSTPEVEDVSSVGVVSTREVSSAFDVSPAVLPLDGTGVETGTVEPASEISLPLIEVSPGEVPPGVFCPDGVESPVVCSVASTSVDPASEMFPPEVRSVSSAGVEVRSVDVVSTGVFCPGVVRDCVASMSVEAAPDMLSVREVRSV